MGASLLAKIKAWLIEVEMGFVWGLAGISIVAFVFAAIWYIDPALLTLVLQFRAARCTTRSSAFLVGISNCSWTSCRLGCTRDVFMCWQVQVDYSFVPGSKAHVPPWGGSVVVANDHNATAESVLARLYPNVRGCGYPPELNCEQFFETYGEKGAEFACWVSTRDARVALTELNLERAKNEVICSLVPLMIFILSVMYAFCRMGVFSVCNPFRSCLDRAKSDPISVEMSRLSPAKLYNYKRRLMARKAEKAKASFQMTSAVGHEEDDDGEDNDKGPTAAASKRLSIPATIEEAPEPSLSSSTSSAQYRRRSAMRAAAAADCSPAAETRTKPAELDLDQLDFALDDIVAVPTTSEATAKWGSRTVGSRAGSAEKEKWS